MEEVEEFGVEEVEMDRFLVEDVEEALEVCSLCTTQRIEREDGRVFVCGTFKARNDYALSKDYPPIEDTFGCNEFKSE